MSVCGQNGQPEDDSVPEEVVVSSVRDMYKQKPASKVVRVLTVLAYLLSVSLAAILLSVYYVCVWKSPDLPPLNDTANVSAQQGNLEEYPPALDIYNSTGGGDTTINEVVTQPSTLNSTSNFTNISAADDLNLVSTDSNLASTVFPDFTPQDTHNGISNSIGAINDTDIT